MRATTILLVKIVLSIIFLLKKKLPNKHSSNILLTEEVSELLNDSARLFFPPHQGITIMWWLQDLQRVTPTILILWGLVYHKITRVHFPCRKYMQVLGICMIIPLILWEIILIQVMNLLSHFWLQDLITD